MAKKSNNKKEIISSEEQPRLYVPKKTLKDIAFEECKKAGFYIKEDTSVVYAICTTQEEADRFVKFLEKKFGEKGEDGISIPFSYGYCVGVNKTQNNQNNLAVDDYERDDI